MMKKKGFWYFLMSGAILLWIAVIWLGYVLFPDSVAGKAALPVLLLLMHCAEIPVSSKIGRAKGISGARIVVNTAIFGFTWWLPLKKGVFD
ncbi:MAG: hypothetical protein JRD43_04500 [Deltaproteobacteria bacterium]|nr:hypothetical protein [Deltaproteobacteria bacterium]MBW2596348.1 hypothetical protein [Deltaproteobacteria bacterium]MBW2650666.1 hypothetical protein [Deltaproteobacteria bacterium]